MQATDLLYNWNETLPIDPTIICHNCNVSVKYDKISHIDTTNKIIYICKDLKESEQRLQVAYFLANLFNVDNCLKFALELLIPQHAFIRYMLEYNDTDKVSEIFGLDRCCVEARYYQLRRYFIR